MINFCSAINISIDFLVYILIWYTNILGKVVSRFPIFLKKCNLFETFVFKIQRPNVFILYFIVNTFPNMFSLYKMQNTFSVNF